MKTAANLVCLIDHKVLLYLFRGYVDACIENYTYNNRPRPVSFDEWYSCEYLAKQEEYTDIIEMEMSVEEASGGFLSGRGEPKKYEFRIPKGIVTETGGIVDLNRLSYFAYRLSQFDNGRLPCVTYNGKTVYNWSWTKDPEY